MGVLLLIAVGRSVAAANEVDRLRPVMLMEFEYVCMMCRMKCIDDDVNRLLCRLLAA